MIGKPRGVGALNEAFELFEVISVELVCRPKVDGDSVLDDPVLLQNGIKHLKRTATVDHEVFRDDLEPIHHRLLFENVAIVWDAQTYPDSVISVGVERVFRHLLSFSFETPPLSFRKRRPVSTFPRLSFR